MDVDRLIEIEHAIWAPAERVNDVMRVLGAESGK